MSEQRRRRKGGGSGGSSGDGNGLPVWAWVVGVILVLLLGANLVFAWFDRSDGGDPQGFVTPDLLLAVGFWAPVVLLVGACGFGLWCVEQAKERRDMQGIGWMRGSFVFGLIGVSALGVATFEQTTFPRQELIVLAMWVFGIQMVLFARTVQKQTESHGSSGRKRKPQPLSQPNAAAQHERGEADADADARTS